MTSPELWISLGIALALVTLIAAIADYLTWRVTERERRDERIGERLTRRIDQSYGYEEWIS